MLRILSAAACAAVLVSCAAKGGPSPSPTTMPSMPTPAPAAGPALAELLDEQGAKVGDATLSPVATGVRIVIEFRNLPPGDHALHIHNVGDCHVGEGGAKSFSAAGPHFNPFGKKHGRQNPEGPHAGDLPNFTVAGDGTARVDIVAELVTLDEGKSNSLFQKGGTCLVVHAKADDEKTDPAGNAGQRLACGTIRKP